MPKTRNYLKKFLTCSALAPMIIASPAFAQDVPRDEATTTEETSKRLEVVTVTAQKREQSAQDVGAAIAAVSGDSLNDRGITDAADLQFIVPSLVAGKSQGNTAFTIRGVGFNTVGAPAVAVHVDGLYQPRPAIGDLAQIDIDRVEVLRGPQGTLYGRNANGGVINFLSKRPTDEFEGYVKGGAANFAQTLFEGVLNAPMGDNAGVRVLFSHKEQGQGFIENISGGPDINDEGHDAVRIAFDATLTDSVSFELTASHIERDGAVYVSNAQTRPFTTGARGAPFGNLFAFGGDLYSALGADWTGDTNRTTVNGPVGSDRAATIVSAVLNWDLGNFNAKSITGYQDVKDHHWSDFDGTDAAIYEGRILRDSETWTQEFNLAGQLGPVDAVFGAFYMDDSFSNDLSINQPNGNGSFQPGALLSFDTPYYDSTTAAVFTDLTWNITDEFRLIGGLRYSDDKQKTFQDFNIDADIEVAPGVFITLGSQCNAALPELSYNSTTPRIGAQYDVSDTSNVYVNYSEGFKVGGYNTDGTCNNEYLPEKIKAYETGWKSTLLDGSMTLNATAFFYDYTNLQLQQIIGTGVDIINAPKAEVKGIELETNYRPTDALTLHASLALLDAKYTEFFNTNGADAGGSNGPVDLKGNRLNSAPEVSVNAGIEYRFENVIAGGSLGLRTDLSYRSEMYLREFNSPEETQGAYTIANASATWTNAKDDFAIRIYGTNLTDEEYLTQSQWSAPINARAISWGIPREYGVELLFNF